MKNVYRNILLKNVEGKKSKRSIKRKKRYHKEFWNSVIHLMPRKL